MNPNFSYQLGNSVNFARTLNAASRAGNLQRKLDELKTAYDLLETAHATIKEDARNVAALTEVTDTLRVKAGRSDDLEQELSALRQDARQYVILKAELPALRDKARRCDELERELPALRHDARQYTALKAELPTLRYKSKRYDELKDLALVWRAKADRFDRFAAKRWVRFVLPLLGLPLAFKSLRSQKPVAPKSGANSRGRQHAAAGDAAGEASEGDPVTGAVPGLKRADTASPPIVQQNPFALSPAGLVCIVTRKPIRNVTRAPRLAKALVDAGYGVVVLSLGLPVPQLQKMCPEVEYIEFPIRPYTIRLRYRWEQRRRKRSADRIKREEYYQAALAKSGLRGYALRARRTAWLPWQLLVGLCWQVLVAAPCALLFKTARQGFFATWRELANEDAIQVAIRFVMVTHQWASSYALAEEADKATRGRRFDIVQAYDNFALIAAARLAARDGARLIYDAVELASKRVALEPNIIESIRERLERRQETGIIRKSDAVITVSDGLSDWYARHCRIERPLVVRNCRYYWPYQNDGRLRADAGVGPEMRLLVWCGSLYPQQGIELIINALPHLAPHIHAAIIGFFQPSWKSYVQEVLPALVASLGVADRVHFLSEREPNDIVPYISGADIGVIPAWGEQVNNLVSLPNKFHEMVMARLPLASSRLGATVDMINKYEIGAIFDERDLANIAAVIEAMLEPSTYARLRANVMKAAEILTWEKESLPYVELIGSLMPPPPKTAAKQEAVSQQAVAKPGGTAERPRVVAEVRAILRAARVAERSAVGKAGPAARQNAAASPAIRLQSDKGVVCIVSRKRINNITRAPRMAKALVDGGCEVVVVSLGRPVPQLQEMCAQVQYLEVRMGAFVRDLTIRCQDFWRKQKNYREQRDAKYQAAVAKGGLRALARRFGRAAKAPVRLAARLSWRLFVVTPSTLLLKKPSQGFAQRWRELALQDAVGITREFTIVQNQRWLTHALADKADQATRGRRFDVVQAYDNYALVAAARLAARDGARLIYDAVELTSHRLALDLNLVERRRERLERREETRIARKADGMIAIGGALADWYARHYHRPRPVVVRNCRYFWPYEVDGRLRADAGVGPEGRLLVWCGSLYPQQGIELLIRLLPHLPPHIHAAIIGFYQPRWKDYAREVLPALAASLGVTGRVHFLPEREPNDIVPYISGADIGVIPAWGEQINNLISLPNKFHEMVMARLPLASSRLGETVDMINQYEIGAIFDERDLVRAAAIIEGMLEPSTYARLKANVMKAAEIFTWEKESLAYVEFVESLMPPQFKRAAAVGSCETLAEQQPVIQPAPLPAEAAAAMPKKAMPANAASGRWRAAKGTNLIEENAKLRATNEHLRASYLQSAEANKKLRDAIDNSRTVSQFYRDSTSVNHYLRFARYCYERAGGIKAEAYVAHGVEALPAADAVAKAVGGRVYCDVIEMPSFAQRSVTYDLHPTSHSLLDHAFDGYLRGAAGLSTVGWALGNQLQRYGPRVTVIPNYRNREQLQRSDQIREKCRLGSEQRLLLASSTIASGLEPIIEALKLLPDNVHLATLGAIFRDYRSTVEAAVQRSGVASRVHFLDPVPYDQLATVASGADIGLMAIDPSLMHWQISLPNRLFDCIAAGLPIVTPDVPDIARIVAGQKIGIALAENDARSWADAIAAALNDEEALRANVLAASEELVWESLGDKLHAAYDHAASITIIGFTDLIGHQRTIRMANTLMKRGVHVTICCPHEGPVPPDEMPGVRIVLTPRPLAISPAANAPSAPVSKPNGATAVEPVSEVPAAKANGAAAPANGVPVLPLSVSGPLQIPSRTEQASLERLKKEVIELRYKARRYDEVKGELPAWQAKAARYDRMKGKAGGVHLVSLRRALRLFPANRNEKRQEQEAAPS